MRWNILEMGTHKTRNSRILCRKMVIRVHDDAESMRSDDDER